MSISIEKYKHLINELGSKAKLVAVSKTKTASDIKALYDLGQKDFGENYVQELVDKYEALPKDIRWHYIGHLQSNKVKYIAPFVSLIHSVDSLNLLKEINKQSVKNNRVIDCLLQIHIAAEETKFGLGEEELLSLLTAIKAKEDDFRNIKICGLMGIATFTDNIEKIRGEFKHLKLLFDKHNQFSILNSQFSILSMGMSSDYQTAIEEGSNMVRIGSLIFGERKYNQ